MYICFILYKALFSFVIRVTLFFSSITYDLATLLFGWNQFSFAVVLPYESIHFIFFSYSATTRAVTQPPSMLPFLIRTPTACSTDMKSVSKMVYSICFPLDSRFKSSLNLMRSPAITSMDSSRLNVSKDSSRVFAPMSCACCKCCCNQRSYAAPFF